MPVYWVDVATNHAPAPDEQLTVYLYAHPRQETDLRAVLATVPNGRGFLSPLVPPGELRGALNPIDDEQARELAR